MFVRKICTYNFDEIDYRSQFHQHFTHAFLYENSLLYEKGARKMLMKLTPNPSDVCVNWMWQMNLSMVVVGITITHRVLGILLASKVAKSDSKCINVIRLPRFSLNLWNILYEFVWWLSASFAFNLCNDIFVFVFLLSLLLLLLLSKYFLYFTFFLEYRPFISSTLMH